MPSFEKPGRVSEVTGRLWERAQRSPLLQRCPSKLKAALGVGKALGDGENCTFFHQEWAVVYIT